MLCEDLEGWDGVGGRETQGAGGICTHIADSHRSTAKLTQQYKAVILLKKKKKEFPAETQPTSPWQVSHPCVGLYSQSE